ncbi:MAG TPA: CYCXC family (seleno)protein [Candidatus Binataceae bacterium]
MAALAALAIVAVGVGAWTIRSAADSPAATNATGERPTLDPARFFGVVREAYEVAQKNPALLAQLHCYCGCDKEVGHRNLLDCYRDEHGAHCPICTGEAVEAAKLADEGLPVEQIRRVLRDHYAHGN